MTKTDSDQLALWRGSFGDAYADRNQLSPELMRGRIGMWSEILGRIPSARPASILEVGANIGNNLRVLGLLTEAQMWAVEPSDTARARLVADGVVPAERALDGAAEKLPLGDGAVDLALTCGVLIHVHPDRLEAACREIHRVARRYIVCAEYFSVHPEAIDYRGHQGYLFKRDFGGLWLDLFPDLETLGYGFSWKRLTGNDNLTWWLFRKPAA